MAADEPSPDDPAAEHLELPSWLSPPRDETGTLVSLNRSLYRDSQTAITVGDRFAYSTGFEFHLGIFRRTSDFGELYDFRSSGSGKTASAKTLMLLIEYADGRHVTNLDEREDSTDAIHLIGGGGGGSQTSFRVRYWVAPLPPAGPVTLNVKWPAARVPETSIEFPSATILDAAQRSTGHWPTRP